MKIRKFLLGGFILVFAIGSAIASAFVPEQAHVRGKTSPTQDQWSCVPIDGVTCDTQGPAECVVHIQVMGVNTDVLAYKGPYFVGEETLCTTPLRRSSVEPVAGTAVTTIYEIRPTDAR